MENNKLVSIIIPCYNGEKFLRAALDSAINQTYSLLEIIVVDDGSTDKSVKIAESYGDPVKVIKQKNSGVSAARNTGIMSAKGKYIMLLDADDIITPESLSNKMHLMDKNPAFGIIVSNYREISEDGQPLNREPKLRKYSSKNAFYETLKQSLPPSGWLFRKEVFRQCGYFDPLIKGGEDWDMFIRASARFGVGYDPSPSLYYRQNMSSASRNIVMMYYDSMRVLRKNSMLSKNKLKYWFYAQIGGYFACEFAMYRLFKSSNLIKVVLKWLGLLFRYPKFFFHSVLVLIILPYRIVWLKLSR